MTFKRTKKGSKDGPKIQQKWLQYDRKVFLQLYKYPQYSKYGPYYVYNTFSRENKLREIAKMGFS